MIRPFIFLVIGDLGQRNLVIWPCSGVYPPPHDVCSSTWLLLGTVGINLYFIETVAYWFSTGVSFYENLKSQTKLSMEKAMGTKVNLSSLLDLELFRGWPQIFMCSRRNRFNCTKL